MATMRVGAVDEDEVAREVVRELPPVGGLGPRSGERLVLDGGDLKDVALRHRTHLVASRRNHLKLPQRLVLLYRIEGQIAGERTRLRRS